MSVLAGLHGGAAAIIICSLLFVDELGVPLPFAPNEALLVFAGLLIAGGALPPLLFLPLAVISMTAGMVAGFLSARALGSDRLRAVAARLRAERHVDRAAARIRQARPRDIALARLLPGIRPYATLIAGASGMELRVFLRGALPAILVWTGTFTALGVLVGLPAEHFLNRFERLGVTGGLLALLVLGTILVARRVPATATESTLALSTVPRRWRTVLAILLDLAVALSLVAAVDRILHATVHRFHPSTANQVVLFVGIVVLGYLVVSRRLAGTTVGERVFGIRYHRLRRRPRRPAAASLASSPPPMDPARPRRSPPVATPRDAHHPPTTDP